MIFIPFFLSFSLKSVYRETKIISRIYAIFYRGYLARNIFDKMGGRGQTILESDKRNVYVTCRCVTLCLRITVLVRILLASTSSTICIQYSLSHNATLLTICKQFHNSQWIISSHSLVKSRAVSKIYKDTTYTLAILKWSLLGNEVTQTTYIYTNFIVVSA